MYVFDNLVLEVKADFIELHPGGKFNLTHNKGRDISKFFFGGYNLVNKPGVIRRPWHHSQAALDIVRGFIIGVIEGQEKVGDHDFKIANKQGVNDNTSTFTFKEVDGKAVDNLKRWYNDPKMIGRHFLVQADSYRRVKRQYTICSAIGQPVRDVLLTLAKNVCEGASEDADTKFL